MKKPRVGWNLMAACVDMFQRFMSFSSFVSSRLSLRDGHRRNRPPAIIVAMCGIAVSFIVMLLSIAVVKGFKNEIKRKIMGFDAQITVVPLAGYYGADGVSLTLDRTLRNELSAAISEVSGDYDGSADSCCNISLALTASHPGILKTANDFLGVLFRGYGEGHDNSFERSILLEGALPERGDAWEIAISATMARKLSLSVGDKVDAYFITPAGVRPRKFDISGIYQSNFGEYDEMVVFAPFAPLCKLGGYADGQGAAVEIGGIEEKDILSVAQSMQRRLNDAYASGRLPQSLAVTTVYSSGAVYFNWLDLLDANVVVILVLMGFVSGFMLISCVIILILRRIKMIGVLKALGAADSAIRGVFIRLGIRVTFSGLLAGNVVGLLLVWLQGRFHLVPLDPASYYLSHVPVMVTWPDWLLLNAGVVAVAFGIMLIPTAIISRLSPVKPLRFE